jgi:D-alanyl-D-alanine carboxypeptidase (penicillin-binding protein 5/6)
VKQEVLATLDSDAVMVSPKLTVAEILTVRDLLHCMIVSAANDAAVVLADHIMGGQVAFVAEMNRYANNLGCTNTNFVNVHGLHHDEQYTSARDVARILAAAVHNELFCEIFFADKYVVPATNKNDSRILVSQNYLLNKDIVVIHYDERVKGSRTGTTTDGTTNIASYAEVDDMKLISVVMGSASAYDEKTGRVKVFGGYGETQKMLDLGFTGNKAGQLIYENQVLKQIPIAGGSSGVTIASKEARSSVIPADMTLDQLEYRYVNEVPLSLPILEGQRVSTLQVWCNNICVAQTDIFAMSNVVAADQVFSVALQSR